LGAKATRSRYKRKLAAWTEAVEAADEERKLAAWTEAVEAADEAFGTWIGRKLGML
jgi:hypothetical protein